MIESTITNFLNEKNWYYKKRADEDGSCYFTMGLTHNSKNYQVVLEHDFEEKYFAVTVVSEKKLSPKYNKVVLDIYNRLAQQQTPLTHIFTEHGMVASKYNLELLDEALTPKRIDYMIERTLIDVIQLYPALKKVVKQAKKKVKQ